MSQPRIVIKITITIYTNVTVRNEFYFGSLLNLPRVQLRTLPPVVVVNFILHRVSDYPFPIIHVTKPG